MINQRAILRAFSKGYIKFEDPILNKNLHSSISDYEKDEKDPKT